MKTLLLIEGQENARTDTAELLTLAGYAVLTAADGKSGIEQAVTNHPDLVICEIDLPELDGYGVIQVFNQHPQLVGTPFVFLTARAHYRDWRRSMELGADDFLTKPCDGTTLLRAIAARLHRRELAGHRVSPAPFEAVAAPGHNNLSHLLAGRKPHATNRGLRIYTEGDEPVRMYFVQSGLVKTVKSTPTGKELITGFYRAGEFFGHKALLSHAPYHDSAVAVRDGALIYIPVEEFTDLLLHNPGFAQQLIQRLADRIREREQQLVDMAYGSLRRRVADALLRLAGPDDDAILLSRDELAAVVGTAPESLSRILGEFRQDGLTEVSAKSIRLLRPDQLRRANW
jgi:CRP/FNR family cyclic AMP-dependent transcriptional regulator